MNQSDAGQQRTFIAPEIYCAQLAAVHVATGALITDPADRVLLVKPFSRPHWLLPGGMAYEGEPPEVACARELDEELGLRVEVGRLLVVDWAPPSGHRTRPLLYLLFDAGTVDGPVSGCRMPSWTTPGSSNLARRRPGWRRGLRPGSRRRWPRGITVYRPAGG
jgi:ADP-ribose pyrophosphatase YjhB (NUDIX family)